MARFIRRLLVFALLGAAAAAAVRALRGRPARDGAARHRTDVATARHGRHHAGRADGAVRRVATAAVPPPGRGSSPSTAACPTGYPVKANASSHIYHVPGGQFYDRTVPERCYTDPQAAEADGYRAARR